MEKASLSLVWWNTSLSPPVSSKRGVAEGEKIKHVFYVIRELLNLGYDFICLGEVCDKDIDLFTKTTDLDEVGYSVVKAADKLDRSYFDTCIIYKKEHFLIPVMGENTKYLAFDSATNKLKIATKFYFKLSNVYESDLVLYLSHWPSKLKDNYLNTTSISERCRIDIEMQLESVENIILMGDFNVEPYEDAMVHHLQTSREKDIVRAKAKVFYNPFWKFLTDTSSLNCQNKGTYYYPSGRFHRKLILDQMVFSSSFLKGDWIFKDEYVNILDVGSIKGATGTASDHSPVSVIIERKVT